MHSLFLDANQQIFFIILSDLSSERQKFSTSVQQTRKLYSQVKHLGQELGQAKQEKDQVGLTMANILTFRVLVGSVSPRDNKPALE
jgi:hypothetical protein